MKHADFLQVFGRNQHRCGHIRVSDILGPGDSECSNRDRNPRIQSTVFALSIIRSASDLSSPCVSLDQMEIIVHEPSLPEAALDSFGKEVTDVSERREDRRDFPRAQTDRPIDHLQCASFYETFTDGRSSIFQRLGRWRPLEASETRTTRFRPPITQPSEMRVEAIRTGLTEPLKEVLRSDKVLFSSSGTRLRRRKPAEPFGSVSSRPRFPKIEF